MVKLLAKQGFSGEESCLSGRCATPVPSPSQGVRRLTTGETLFKPNDPRQAYRVEQGALCHYVLWSDGSHDVVEFAFPGEIVGLGTLDHHVSTAQAMVDTVVSVVGSAELSQRLAADDFLALKAATAYDVEFDFIRQRAAAEDRGGPAKRLARYLCAVMAIAASEGHSGDVITDDVDSGYVASVLDMSLDTLTQALLSLERSGVVAASSEGLRIVDAHALERLAA